MNTATAPAVNRPASAVVYPLEVAPAVGGGEAVQIAPGVLWLRMPLHGPLGFINVWALEDGDGWALVDTGIRSSKTATSWQVAFEQVLGGRPVRRVISTHMHPDHCGMAGWIADRFDAPLLMSRLEYLMCRLMASDTGHEAPEAGIRFYRRAGWSVDAIDDYKARFGLFGVSIYPLPAAYQRLKDGDELTIGGHAWRVVTGAGHSPEHVSLHCPDLKLMISGDQVLPKISSNVSLFPTEPDGDPLSDWLGSLAKVKAAVPDDVLVLPAHKDPFRGLHVRLDELAEGHREGLDKLMVLLAEKPRRAIDVFEALFVRQITTELLGMATGESLAHLNHLVATGRAVRETDAEGVYWWRACH